MRRHQRYKIAIWVLSFIVIIQVVFIIFLIITKPKKIPKVPVAIKGKIAIVIDDWGYNLNNISILDQINYPLTISILPNLNFSNDIAGQLHKRGYEIILHLPMEPHEKFRLEQNTLMTSMDELTITNIIDKDLANVPYAFGVSNHMGSKATEDKKTMQIIFAELKRRGLYFLDSLVSSKSICFILAKNIQLGFVRRDVFLDNKEEAGYIRGQIYKLKTRAGLYGQAIGIGHDRKITLEALREVMPQIEKQGYKFVFVSELIR